MLNKLPQSKTYIVSFMKQLISLYLKPYTNLNFEKDFVSMVFLSDIVWKIVYVIRRI